MKLRSALLVLVLIVLASCSASAVAAAAARAAPSDPAPGGETWTVALYVNADNDLDYTWPRFTLPALKRIPPSDAVNVVAMVDREKGNGSFLYKVSGTRVTTVRHFPAERDFGSGKTFRWFLEQVHARFPSDRLVVIGWDHGYAWHYFSHDHSSGQRISMPELRAALKGAGVPIDILAFDACDMGALDVAWDVASVSDPAAPGDPLVDYFVGSEETIDQDGYPYDTMFAPLAGDPSRTPEQVTADMLRGWDTYYGSLRCFDWLSLSALDLRAVQEAGPQLADFVGRLRAGLASDRAKYGVALRDALGTSIHAWDSWQVDLGMLAGQLVARHRLDDDPGLLASASAVRGLLRDTIVLGVTSGSYARWYEGATVWAGTGDDWSDYRRAYRSQSLFGSGVDAGGVDWYRLLRDYNASGQADARLPDPKLQRATYGLTDVLFADARRGWATGYDNVAAEGVVLRTTDGGRSWKTTRPSDGGAYAVNAITRAPGGSLWVAGSEGWSGSLIARSGSAGAEWRYINSPTVEYLLDIDSVSAERGLAAGTGGTLLRTNDRGRTWKRIATAPPGDLLGLEFTSASEGWVLANEQVAMSGSVRRTTDGGATWAAQTVVPGAFLYAVGAVGDDVWVAGGDPSAGPLLGGERVSGDGVLLHSADGGATWETQWGGGAADLRLSDVDMLDASIGWAVGDGSAAQESLILHTTDGGSTWTPQDAGDVHFDLAAVHVLDAQTAWVVGDGEEILVTTDAGATWGVTRGDVVGPVTRVKSATARRGSRVTLTWFVKDAASSRAKVTLRVSDGHGHLFKSRRLGWCDTGSGAHTVTILCDLPRGVYSVKARATDRAGNAQSRMLVGKLRVR